ncbi:MAG: carbohydrate ABC transporter permease [Fimbriimonas sp.]
MTTNLLFAVGTLSTWIGWVLGVRAVYFLVQYLMNTPGMDRYRLQKGMLFSAVGAAAALGIGQMLPQGASTAAGPRLPLVWFVMPWTAWIAAVAVAMVLARALQAWLALNPRESMDRLKAAGLWLAAVLVALYLYRGDPENKITILTGAIPFSGRMIAIFGFLALAAMVAMGLAARATSSRNVAATLSAQAALLAGSFIFGLPFAVLVITSFKEDRDMSSPNGIVWIPKVQEKIPYMDKKNPLYEVQRDGQRIEGEIVEKRPDGTVKIDVFKPLAIRGTTFEARESDLKPVPRDVDLVNVKMDGQTAKGMVIDDLDDGRKLVQVLEPATLKGREMVYLPKDVEPIRNVGLRWQNYQEAISFLPPETNSGLVYLKNSLIIVIMSVIGTLLSSSIVAYAFSRMRFPGRNALFVVLLSTMMLPAAVTMLPQFLIFRTLGWIDTLLPLWVPAFFGSAFNIFLLRQFFMQIPMELEDASKIDGCGYAKTFWSIMMPQIKPALAVIAVWTFMGAWNNFMGPLIYINSPENMPLSYALQLFNGDRAGEPGLLMAFATLTVLPVLLLFFFAQRYFIEGVTLSGLGGR